MVRTFVALPLPQMIQQRLYDAGQVLLRSSAEIKSVAPSLMHITLSFLGEVRENQIPVIADALKNISQTPFEIHIGPVTANNMKNPRVIWAQISDAGECKNVYRQVEHLLEPLGFLPESRPFRPHITIARVKLPHQDLLPILISSLSSTTYGSCTINRCVFMKSVLNPSGPDYSELAEVKFEKIGP